MIGTIMGTLELSRGGELIREQRWVQVRSGSSALEAVDLAGCRKGDTVLLISGETARHFAPDCPGDWAVAAVLTGQGNNG